MTKNKSGLLSRREATQSILLVVGGALGGAAALFGCTSETGAGTTGGGTTGDAGASGTDGASGNTDPDGPLASWASGGTASMTGAASYPDPFATAVTSCVLAATATAGPCTEAADQVRKDVSEGYTGLPMRLALRVVDAAHGLDESRAAWIVPELRSQVRDVHVHRTIEGLVGAASHDVDQLLAREHPSGSLGERTEQHELVGRERQHRAVERRAHGLGIDAQASHAHRLLRGTRTSAGAPRVRADPREELAGGERLRDVVVGAALQAHDTVRLLATGGDHDDGRVDPRAQLAAHGEAVHAGQHQIEEDHVGSLVHHLRDAVPTVPGEDHPQPVRLEVARGQPSQALVVLYQDHRERRSARSLGRIHVLERIRHPSSMAALR